MELVCHSLRFEEAVLDCLPSSRARARARARARNENTRTRNTIETLFEGSSTD